MSTSFWEDFKRTVTSGFNVAAEKTKEYTKIGKLEIDIINLKRSVDKSMSELGRNTYQIYKSGKKADISEDGNVKKVVKKIDDLKSEIAAKEKEIADIKKEEPKKNPEQGKTKPKKTTVAKPEAKIKKSTKSTPAKTGTAVKPSSAKKTGPKK